MGASQRATLLHNPSAGDARPTADDLKDILREAGFQVRYRSLRGEWKKALDDAGDLVVAAGGDGTVGKIARELVGHDVPLALLPAGTANNIARTLRLTGDARQIVAGWTDARPRPFDVGLVSAPSTEARFAESAGGGVFAQAIVGGSEEVDESSTLVGGEIDRAVLLVRRLLGEARPERWEVELDGTDHSGDYVAVEAMNIRFIGPSIPLAPEAETGDGLLDFALVGDQERRLLLEYLERRVDDASAVAPPVPVIRARRAILRPPAGIVMHVDDDELDTPPDKSGEAQPIAYEMVVQAGAISILPPTGERLDSA